MHSGCSQLQRSERLQETVAVSKTVSMLHPFPATCFANDVKPRWAQEPCWARELSFLLAPSCPEVWLAGGMVAEAAQRMGSDIIGGFQRAGYCGEILFAASRLVPAAYYWPASIRLLD